MYFATDLSRLYGPKSAGAWPAGVSLTGATGATGATGSGNGKSLYVTDGNGTDIGLLVSYMPQSQYVVLIDGAVWNYSSNDGKPWHIYDIRFLNSSCSVPVVGSNWKISTNDRIPIENAAYKVSGSWITAPSSWYFKNSETGVCTSVSKTQEGLGYYYTLVGVPSPPTYVPPFAIVSK
jgi:hypothetical protein